MEFLDQYFLQPLMRNGWFNPVNSIVYGIGLVIGIMFVFKLLKKLDVPIDNKLLFTIIPFIAFAGVTRTMRDFIFFSISGRTTVFQSFSAHMGTMQQAAYDYIYKITGNQLIAYLDSYVIATGVDGEMNLRRHDHDLLIRPESAFYLSANDTTMVLENNSDSQACVLLAFEPIA